MDGGKTPLGAFESRVCRKEKERREMGRWGDGVNGLTELEEGRKIHVEA